LAGVLVVADVVAVVPFALEPAAFAGGFDALVVAAPAEALDACLTGWVFTDCVFTDCVFTGAAFGVLVDARGGVFTATIRFLPGLALPASPACG
jgi:hypothetical protein